MFAVLRRAIPAIALLAAAPLFAQAQDGGGFGSSPALPDLALPALNTYASPKINAPLAAPAEGEVTLEAELVDKGPAITRGLVWRVFKPEPGPDGKLPLVASAQGGTSAFELEPGSYLVHAAFGRAGATKRITVGREAKREVVVLDAGGLKLDAVTPGGQQIPPKDLRFSIYEAARDADGDRPLIVPDVHPDTVVRLNAGVYHVVSNYGSVNAVIRSDIRVEAGKLTQATVEHRAAELTIKLVREHGGEAMADTSWSVLTDAGETIYDNVGAYASMVLAEGDYVIVAKNRGHIYQRAYTVEAGHNEEVEVLANEESQKKVPLGDISD
jgi:hypothetical protein